MSELTEVVVLILYGITSFSLGATVGFFLCWQEGIHNYEDFKEYMDE